MDQGQYWISGRSLVIADEFPPVGSFISIYKSSLQPVLASAIQKLNCTLPTRLVTTAVPPRSTVTK